MIGAKKEISSPEGLEPTRAEHNGLAGHRLNHSAKATGMKFPKKFEMTVLEGPGSQLKSATTGRAYHHRSRSLVWRPPPAAAHRRLPVLHFARLLPCHELRQNSGGVCWEPARGGRPLDAAGGRAERLLHHPLPQPAARRPCVGMPTPPPARLAPLPPAPLGLVLQRPLSETSKWQG